MIFQVLVYIPHNTYHSPMKVCERWRIFFYPLSKHRECSCYNKPHVERMQGEGVDQGPSALRQVKKCFQSQAQTQNKREGQMYFLSVPSIFHRNSVSGFRFLNISYNLNTPSLSYLIAILIRRKKMICLLICS